MKELSSARGYFVTEDGEVFSTSKNYSIPKKLSFSIDKRGYHRVRLQVASYKQKLYSVHRLVAETYIPNPHGYSDVHHKDGDPTNNNVSNLEWCSHKKNCEYSRSTIGRNKATSWTLLNTKTGEELVIFNMAQWCEENDIDRSNLSKTLRTGWSCKNWRVLAKQ